jgi:hypothetical protein
VYLIHFLIFVFLQQKLEEEADYRAKTRGLLREPTLGGNYIRYA